MFTIIAVCAMAVIVAGNDKVTGADTDDINLGGEQYQYVRRVKQDDPLAVDKTCECKGQYIGQDFAVYDGGMTFIDLQGTVIYHLGLLFDLERDVVNLDEKVESGLNTVNSHIGTHDEKLENLQSYIQPFELNFEAHDERIDTLETSDTNQDARIRSLETCCNSHDVRMEVLEMKLNALQQGINICGPVGGGYGGFYSDDTIWERSNGESNSSPLDCAQDCIKASYTIGMYSRFSWGGRCRCLGPWTDNEDHPFFGLTCLEMTSSRLNPPSHVPYPEGGYYLLPKSFSDVCPSEEGMFGPGCVLT